MLNNLCCIIGIVCAFTTTVTVVGCARPEKSRTGAVVSVSFSPSGQVIASACELPGRYFVRVRDLRTNKDVLFHERPSPLTSVVFSPDGKLLVSAGLENDVYVWETGTWNVVKRINHPFCDVWSVAISPDSKIVAIGDGSSSPTVWLIELSTGKEQLKLEGHKTLVQGVTFSPNGSLLVTIGQRGPINIWDARSGRKLWSFDAHEDPIDDAGHRLCILAVDFAKDNKTIATGGTDKTVRLWDVDKKKEMAALVGHRDDTNSLSFSPDGKLLASSDDSGEIRLWDVSTRKEIGKVLEPEGSVSCIKFSPDGKTLAIGGRSLDAEVRLMRIDQMLEKSK